MTTVSIDSKLCMFQGLCAGTAPTVFDFDDVEGPTVVRPHPKGTDIDDARLAEKMCPAQAISVVDEDPETGRNVRDEVR